MWATAAFTLTRRLAADRELYTARQLLLYVPHLAGEFALAPNLEIISIYR
jgi:hypothetical protein